MTTRFIRAALCWCSTTVTTNNFSSQKHFTFAPPKTIVRLSGHEDNKRNENKMTTKNKILYTCMGDTSIEFGMTMDQAKSCSHSGDNEDAVRALLAAPAIYSQLNTLDPKQIARALKGYGAWDEAELADHDMNLVRFLWIAAGNIADGEGYE